MKQPPQHGNELYKRVKKLYFAGRDWNIEKLLWAGYDPKKTAKVFAAFAPFFVISYDCLFVEWKFGDGIVTAISDEGIRIESIPTPGIMEWVHVNQIKAFRLKPQAALAIETKET
jgi:hypothetical protein